MKKGQISYFVIIAIIITVLYAITIYTKGNYSLDAESREGIIETSAKEIRNYVENCIKPSAEDAIFNTALRGGYYNETNNTISYSFFIISLYSLGKINSTPSINKIGIEISFNLNDNILKSVNNFTVFKNRGLEVLYEKPISKVRILDNKILFDVDFSVWVIKSGRVIIVPGTYSTSVTSNYRNLYNFASYTASLLSNQPDKLCISCMIDYAEKNNLEITVSNFDTNTIVFAIEDKSLGSNLVFRFAHKRDDSNA